MQTDNKKNKISISEVARTLGWPVTTADSIRRRKSPKDKYEILLKCEATLSEMREKVIQKMQNETNQ